MREVTDKMRIAAKNTLLLDGVKNMDFQNHMILMKIKYKKQLAGYI